MFGFLYSTTIFTVQSCVLCPLKVLQKLNMATNIQSAQLPKGLNSVDRMDFHLSRSCNDCAGFFFYCSC